MNKLKITIQAILLIGIGAVGLVGCVSLNSHHTGRSVGKDNYSLVGSFNFGRIDSEQYFTFNDSGVFYIAETGAFFGIKENFDIGLKVNSSFHFTGMSKFQFMGDKQSIFASSLGLDVGAGPLGAVLGVMSYSASVSLFNSIHPTDYLAFTLSPRYTYLGFTNFTEEYGFTRRNHIYGYSAGLIIGRELQFSFELSQYVNNTEFSINTKPIISLGYIWNIKYPGTTHTKIKATSE